MKEKIDICLLDFSYDDKEIIEKKGFSIYNGSAGKRIKLNYQHKSNFYCLANYDLPSNFHEYEVLIINMNDYDFIQYQEEDHIRNSVINNSEIKFLVSKPTNIFDPKPLSYRKINNEIAEFSKKPSLIIVFAGKEYEIEYRPIKIKSGDYHETQNSFNLSNYSFISDIPLLNNKHGKIFKIITKNTILKNFFEKYKNIEYYQTFNTPKILDDKNLKYIDNPNFHPILENNSNEIISYAYEYENTLLFVFPEVPNKGEFISEFLTEVCPQFLPQLFQANNEFSWLKEKNYWLPNYNDILLEIENEKKRHSEQIEIYNEKIENNKKEFEFLNNLITETGEKLVDAVIHILNFLDFKNISKFDEEKTNDDVLEEDIQIKYEDKLLVIEVKGIGGTSKDSECNQISKIRLRRMKEGKTTNVFALYIVNHQRYLPPLKRTNPPFNPIQMKDAENDDRGLLTTWDLYCLYFDIINKNMTKEEARNMIFDFGLINFRKNLKFLGKVDKTFSDGFIASINLENNIEVEINNNVYSVKNGKMTKHKIINIQQEKNNFKKVTKGLTGIKLDTKIEKNSNLFLR